MPLKAREVKERYQVKRYKVQYPVSAYKFPQETSIHKARLDETYLHIELSDGRLLSIPIEWIPTVYNAAPKEREKFTINAERTAIIWDPEKCAINEDLHIADYLGPSEKKPA